MTIRSIAKHIDDNIEHWVWGPTMQAVSWLGFGALILLVLVLILK